MSSNRQHWQIAESNRHTSIANDGSGKFTVDKDRVDAPDDLLADYADGNCVTDEDALVYLPDLDIDRPVKKLG